MLIYLILGGAIGVVVLVSVRSLVAALGCAITGGLALLVIAASIQEWQDNEQDEKQRGRDRDRVPSAMVGTFEGKFEYSALTGYGVKLRITIRDGKVGENVAEITSSGERAKAKGKCRATGKLKSAFERRIILETINRKCESAYSSYTLKIEPPDEESGGKPRVTFQGRAFNKVADPE